MPDTPQHFDTIAREYDGVIPAHIRDHYLRKRVKTIGPLLNGGVGLDVGCGTGLLMAALAPYGTVRGVDASAGMIEVLRAENRGEAVQAPSDHLPFADDEFDAVFCIAMLHHVADPTRVRNTLREMVRVTKPGGHVVVWDHNPTNPYWPVIMKRVPQDTGEERLIPAEEILSALAEAGATHSRVTRGGFVPEFIPRWLMPLAVSVEFVVERVPVLNRLCAHNIITATKGTN